MNPSLYKIPTSYLGDLYVMPKPSSDWLVDDVAYYKSKGIDVIVSLLEFSEARDLGLENEQSVAESSGIAYIHFPIQDRELPEALLFKQLVHDLHQLLEEGKSLAIHCRAGIGRSGVTAACILVESGVEFEESVSVVSSARGVEIPDTEAQKAFIRDFAR